MTSIPSQPPITSVDVSDEALFSLEPSALLVELNRLENSIQKLKESNDALEDLIIQQTSHMERVHSKGDGDDDDDDVGEGATAVTDEEVEMFEEVIRENEQVIARQSLLVDRICDHIESQDDFFVGMSGDAFHTQGGQTATVGST